MNQLIAQQRNQLKGGYTINRDKILGKGQYGIVYDCSHPQIQEELCVKIVKTNSLNDKLIKRESEILMKLKDVDNPNLVKVYDVIPDDEKKELYIIMEKVKGGDLRQKIENKMKDKQPYSTKEILNIFSQIINGYQKLFELNIIHRDLKPANILIDNENIKITDFGMGREMEDMNRRDQYSKVGTKAYASPQIFLGNSYSSKSDIYSLGIILYELTFLSLPFKGNQEQYVIAFVESLKNQQFKCGEIALKGSSEDKDLIKELIEEMLIYDEELRISWKQLIFLKRNCNKLQTDIQTQNNNQLDKISETLTMLQDNESLYFEKNRNKIIEINNFIKLLSAKARLASQLSCALKEVRSTHQQLLSKQTYSLIAICVTGYNYKILQNAFGFQNHSIELICQEMRQISNFTQCLSFYQYDESELSKNVKDQISKALKFSEVIFSQDKSVIQNYEKDLPEFHQFFQLLATPDTSFSSYHNQYKQLYVQYLKEKTNLNLVVQPLSLLKFIALIEMFLKNEEQYPIQKYSELDSTKVYLPENINKAQLIDIIKKCRQQ